MSDPGWDLFISYRRRDASVLARWLCRRLRRYRLPPDVLTQLTPGAQALHERRPRIFLDTDFERASPDFLQRKVYPALDAAKRLLVISTPAAFEPVRDRHGNEQPNWLCLEVERFVGQGAVTDGRPIDVALGPGGTETRFPGRLDENPRWDWVDLRAFTPLRAAGLTGHLDAAVVKLVATLYDVEDRLQESLRQEEQKRRNRTLLFAGSLATVVALVMAGLAAYALDRQVEANKATASALSYLSESRRSAADALATSASRAQADGDALAALRLLTAARASGVTPRVTAQSLLTPVPRATFDVTVLPGGPEGTYVLAFRPGTRDLVTGDYRGRVRLIRAAPTAAPAPEVGGEPGQILSTDGPPVIGLSFASATRLFALRRNTPDAPWNAGWQNQAQASEILQFDTDNDGRFVAGTARAPRDGREWLSIAVLPDGETLLIGTDRDVRLQSDSELAAAPLPDVEAGGLPGVRVSVSPNGALAAASTIQGHIRVWDLPRRALLRQFRVPRKEGAFEYNPFPVAFSPDGRQLAFGSFDGTVHVWRPVDEAQPGRRFRIHDVAVAAVAWNVAGDLIAAGAYSGQTILFDPAGGTVIARLPTSDAGLLAGSLHAAFSDDGTRLATTESVPVGSGEQPGSWLYGTTRLWSVRPLDHRTGLLGVSFDNDGRLFSWTWSGKVAVSNESSMTLVPGVTGMPWTALSRGQSRRSYVSYLTIDRNESTNALGEVSASPGPPATPLIGPSALTPGGRTLALLTGRATRTRDALQTEVISDIRLVAVDTATGIVTRDVHAPAEDVIAWGPMVAHPNDHQVLVPLTARGDTRILDIDLRTGALADRYTWTRHAVSALALSRDGRWLAMSDTMGDAQLLDLTTSTTVPVPEWIAGSSVQVAFDPWAPYFVVAGLGQLRVFDFVDGVLGNERRATVRGRFQPTAIDFVPHDSLLIVGDDGGTVGVWDLKNLSEIVRVPVSWGAVLALRVSPDAERLVTVGIDGLALSGGVVPASDAYIERVTRLTIVGGEIRPLAAAREAELRRGRPASSLQSNPDASAAEFWRLAVGQPLTHAAPTTWWGWLLWRPGVMASPQLEAWRSRNPQHRLNAMF